MALFRIIATASKTFYVEAASKDAAIDIAEEELVSGGEYDWEPVDADTEELDESRANHIRETRSKYIFEP